MRDGLRERITFWVSLLSLLTGLTVLLSAVTGKLGVFVLGPPDLIAQVRAVDSSRSAGLDSILKSKIADADVIHARMDSTTRDHDRRISVLETLASQQMALSCVNTKPRDIALTRIPCTQYVGRWRAPGGSP